MYFVVFKRKINNIFMKKFIKFYQNWRNFSQKFRKKVNEINDFTLFSRNFKPRYLPVKNENEKNLFISIFYGRQAL